MNTLPPSEAEPHPYIIAHIAKLAFRGFLPMFARFWYDAKEAAPPGSLNAKLWPGYLRLLRACQDILYYAPMHPNEAKQANVEPKFVRSLERLATTLAYLFPNGFMELETYVITEDVREWRRTRGVARYKWAKSRRRARRRRR